MLRSCAMLRTYAQNRAGRTASLEHVNDVRAVLKEICQDSVSIKDSQAATALMNWTLKQSEAPLQTQNRVRAAATHVASAMKLNNAVFYESSAYGELLGESLEIPDQFCLQSFIPQTGAMANEMCVPTTGPFGVCKSNPLVLNGIKLLSETGTEVMLEQIVCGITSKSADAIPGNNVDKRYAVDAHSKNKHNFAIKMTCHECVFE